MRIVMPSRQCGKTFAANVELARTFAIEALEASIAAHDNPGRRTALRKRVERIRKGLGDRMPEVRSAFLALERSR